MISKTAHPYASAFKAFFSISVVLAVSFLFTDKSYAQKIQEQTSKALPLQMKTLELTNQDLEEFKILEAKVLTHSSKGNEYIHTTSEKNRLGDIYSKMSKKQQTEQNITLMPYRAGYSKPSPPSKEQFEAFRDPKMYGVWLNGKRIKNSELEKYEHTDFSNASSSTLLKTAIHYGQYKYHLSLTTHEAFKREQLEAKKDTSRYIVFYKQDFLKSIREKTK